MRKNPFLLALFILLVSQAQAGFVSSDLYKFEFNGVLSSTIPTAPAVDAVLYGGTSTSTSMFAVANGAAALNAGANVLFSGGGSGARGSALYNLNANAALPTDKKVVVQFDWTPLATNGDPMAYNTLGISDNAKNPIFTLVSETWVSTGSGVHLMNLTPTATHLTTTWTLQPATYSGTSDYKTDCATFFAGSWLGADFPNAKTYTVKAKLDFATHVIDSIWIIRADDTSKQYVAANIPFLSASANNADKISAMATRGRNATNTSNGANSALNMTVDNYTVYTWEEASALGSITVNYYDADNTTSLIKSEIRPNLAINSIYAASGADKTAFTAGAFYYVFASVAADNALVTVDGLGHVDIYMKKYPVHSGVFSWTGAVDGNWNEATANFSDGTNAQVYQSGNGVEFPEVAINKVVSSNSNFNLGTGNLTISGADYTLQGTGTLSGSGKMNINLTGSQPLTLDLTNNLTGGTQITGGLITLKKPGVLGTASSITGATGIALEANAITLPATTFTAPATISVGDFSSSLIQGMTAGSGVKITINAQKDYASNDNSRAFDFAASGVLSDGAELELNGTGTDNRFGMNSASPAYLANAKLNLKGNAMLYINTNQGGATVINVGSLSGESGAKLGWGRSTALERDITWSVGGLNLDSEYAGSLTNTGGYAGSGSSYTGLKTNLIKVGSGKLTLSGVSDTFNGNLTLAAGEMLISGTWRGNTGTSGSAVKADSGAVLNVTGRLSATILTVSPGAVLKGSGIIDGNTTVQGVLSGGLTFTNDLVLTDSVVLTVAGFNDGEFDQLSVGDSLAIGGSLKVVITANAPANNTSIQLIKSAVRTGTFALKDLPQGYSFDETTGYLSYSSITTGVNDTEKKLTVFPAITRDFVTVEGKDIRSIRVTNLAGQQVMLSHTTSDSNRLNLGQFAKGLYLLTVDQTDGTTSTYKVTVH
jgi:autotransporter-associated beta strand protein